MDRIMKNMLKYTLILALCLALLFCAVCRAEATENSQSLSLTGVGNARELGGYTAADGRTVKRGVLLRTARLSDATEEDVERLLSVYHLAVDVDFRGDGEVEKAPDPEMEGVEYLNIHILDDSAGFAEEMDAEMAALEEQGVEMDKIAMTRLTMKYGIFTDQMYVDFISSDVGKAGYRQFFQALLTLPEDQALLFHCSQGKDRTGCGAMLILFALGADEETVMADFLLTNEYNAALIAEERKYLIENGIGEDELDTFMKTMDQVYPEFMANAIQWMNDTNSNLKSFRLRASFPLWRCFIPVNVALLRLPPFSLAREKNPSRILELF